MREVKAWETVNGKLFTTKEECESFEKKMYIEEDEALIQELSDNIILVMAYLEPNINNPILVNKTISINRTYQPFSTVMDINIAFQIKGNADFFYIDSTILNKINKINTNKNK